MSWVFNLVLVLFGNIRIDFIWILWTVWPQHLVKQTRKPRERKPDKSDRWVTSPWHVWVHDFYPVTCFRCLSTTQWDISTEERIVIHLNQGQELSGRQTTDGQMWAIINPAGKTGRLIPTKHKMRTVCSHISYIRQALPKKDFCIIALQYECEDLAGDFIFKKKKPFLEISQEGKI